MELIEFENQQNANFISSTLYTSNALSIKPIYADKDLDGDIDIMFSNLWFENTNGVFNQQIHGYTVFGFFIENNIDGNNMFMSDFNNDGYQDLITFNYQDDSDSSILIMTPGNSNSDLLTYLNDTIVVFNESQGLELDFFNYIRPILTDVDYDGDIDILFACSKELNNLKIGWYENVNNGNEFNFNSIYDFSYDNVSNVFDFKYTDINNDEKKDIIVNSGNEIVLAYFEGDNNGNFNDPVTISMHGAFSTSQSIASVDLDGNGFEDIFIPSHEENTFYTFYNSSSDFGTEKVYLSQQYNVDYPFKSLAFDFDNDGDEDIAMKMSTQYPSGMGIVLLENDNGTLLPAISIIDSLGWINEFYTKDFDNDGLIDIILSGSKENLTGQQRFITLLKNTNNGFVEINLITENEYTTTTDGYEYFLDFSVADIDNDGDMDVMVVDSKYNHSKWYKNNNGIFTPNIIYPNFLGNFDDAMPTKITSADLNNDGNIDAIVKYSSLVPQYNKVYYYLNDGTGTFYQPTFIDISISSAELIAFDYDNDNDEDVIFVSDTANLTWFINDGNANFNQTELVDTILLNHFALANINNDNYTDIITLSPTLMEDVKWYEGTGGQNNSLNIKKDNVSNIVLYPNPNNGLFFIKGLEKNSEIAIYSLDGKLIQKNKPTYSTFKINIQNKKSGIYFVQIINSNKIETIKIIKN